ncbi:MAG: hypothetical protein ACXAEN_24395 [Candidatus Thorarchaeota archaeon]
MGQRIRWAWRLLPVLPVEGDPDDGAQPSTLTVGAAGPNNLLVQPAGFHYCLYDEPVAHSFLGEPMTHRFYDPVSHHTLSSGLTFMQ